ncbi:MAG: hypothetical protein D6692_05290 [Planctomycetota bacterium]|nr:MAG: hypothetical protein D6692_05290 [Planctomycetota bacterium]
MHWDKVDFDEFEPCRSGLEPCSTGKNGKRNLISIASADEDPLPTDLASYPYEESRVYDLSVSAAASADLPVFSTSGGMSRRVVVLERVKYLIRSRPNGSEAQFGFAIRLLLTVSRLDGKMSLKLPVIAASAQLNMLEAKWQLQVHGLTSEEISAAIYPPTDLDVETFVYAKESMEKVIKAVHASSTKFTPVLIALRPPANLVERHAEEALGRTAALDAIKEGRSLMTLESKLASMPARVLDAAVDMYKAVVGGDVGPAESPPLSARQAARDLLRGTDLRL